MARASDELLTRLVEAERRETALLRERLAKVEADNLRQRTLSRLVTPCPPADVERIAADPLLQYELFKPGKGGMSPGQRRIHENTENNRLVRAGNQVGKTHALCAEVLWQANGRHPFRKVRRDLGITWCIIKDFESGYHEFCQKMHNLEPPNSRHPNCHWSESLGYTYLEGGKRRPWFVTRDGYRVEFKSGTQEEMSLESSTIDALFFDEPPKPGHWSAARARLSVSNGPTLIGFTAVGRPLKWLRREIEGDPETGTPPVEKWAQIVIMLSVETSPHRSQESITAQMARNKAAGSEETRTRGGWEGKTAGARFTAFDETKHVRDRADLMARDIAHFRLSGDYGEGPGKTAFYLTGIVGRKAPYTVLVLGEYVSKETTTPRMDADGVLAMLARAGVPPTAIAKAFGDINSAGKNGQGESCNTLMQKALLQALQEADPRTRALSFRFEVPNKKPGSVAFGEAAIQTAMVEGRFLICDECESLLTSIRHYTGKEEELKHALDGTRYGVDDLLSDAAKDIPPTTNLAALRSVFR